MDNDKTEEARKILQAAIRALPKRKHVLTMLKFVRFEYSKPNGNAERARTVCEGLLDSSPKRTDIWHQYIDAEIKYGQDASKVRRLFERVTTLKISTKKMKGFFKKWLGYETDLGNDQQAEKVKKRAIAYVQSLAE